LADFDEEALQFSDRALYQAGVAAMQYFQPSFPPISSEEFASHIGEEIAAENPQSNPIGFETPQRAARGGAGGRRGHE